ncbi:hypothetical protein E3N88_41661 [Mikania micrantha]|uniref:Reverse transcriptase Ty1/copia-type domain-containing protein n=1 Tax=Mikania micrantha TaxID=192012 RepID=A0A5N6LK01_9ASTR|nr:hypothetical protein E3N88_41661 [Mikania micrantha]
MADTVSELVWLETLLRELHVIMKAAPTLWCDNLGATYLSRNPVFHARTKHIEVDYHTVRERVARGQLMVRFISTKDQIADIFTKPLPTDRFALLKTKLKLDISQIDVESLSRYNVLEIEITPNQLFSCPLRGA